MDQRIFISYSRTDGEFVKRLIADVINQGLNIWLDQRDIAAGQRWDRVIEQALQECDIFVVVLSPNSVASENVLDEISFAIQENKRILPVLYQNCEIPYRIARVQFVDFRGEYEPALHHLVAEVRNLPHAQPAKAKPVRRTWMIVLWVLIACVFIPACLGGGYWLYKNLFQPTPTHIFEPTEPPVTEPSVSEVPLSPTEINPDLPPTFGNVINLEAWFLNDPQMFYFQSGGPVNLSYLIDMRTSNPCNGYASEAPNMIINMAGDSNILKFLYKTSDGNPATLVLQMPNREVIYCPASSDQSEWVFDQAPAGEYRIWIGTFGNNAQDGILYITHDEFFYP